MPSLLLYYNAFWFLDLSYIYINKIDNKLFDVNILIGTCLYQQYGKHSQDEHPFSQAERGTYYFTSPRGGIFQNQNPWFQLVYIFTISFKIIFVLSQ